MVLTTRDGLVPARVPGTLEADLGSASIDQPDATILFGATLRDGADSVEIAAVEAGSAAARKGLRVGDRVVSLDSKWMRDARAMIAYAAERRGQAIAVDIERRGSRFSLVIQ